MSENQNCELQYKIKGSKLVLEVDKNFIINDFNEMMEGFSVKGNRKKKFIEEFGKSLVEHIISEGVFECIYDNLMDSNNVKCLDDEY